MLFLKNKRKKWTLVIHTVVFTIFSPFVFSQEVRSFRSVIDEENATLVPSVTGKWIFDLSATDTLSIQKKGDNFYHLSTANSTVSYEAMFGKIDEILLLQLFPLNPNTETTNGLKTNFLPVYTLYKVDLKGDTLELRGINYSRIFEQVKNNQLPVEYIWSGDVLVLNATSKRLRELIASAKDNLNFFNGEIKLSRIGLNKRVVDHPVKMKTAAKAQQPGFIHTNCIPSFPLKEGWLGGDGNVSVPISSTKTLWLFSDSFVGGKDQTSRKGTSIISNSVGVMSCANNSSIQYYWNGMFGQWPKPIFETFTDRYKFWISDALLYDSILYVVLDKIGPRPDPVPSNETFNFSHLGWSLARVENPHDSPLEWRITYNSLLGIPDKQWDGQFVLYAGYVYMFFRKNQNDFILTRCPVRDIESFTQKMEYYSEAKIWKSGTGGDDAAVLFSGASGQTVEYHPTLRKWIMVIGPGLLSNKIAIRKASRITGPWSGEEIIYQCPEQTPGSPLYHKDNFCYLGREHIQFFNPKSHTMTITYDHNTVNFDKLISDTSIYTPKVITVRLKGQ